MSYEISKLDQKAREAAKQASRDEDARRLAAGEITKQELRKENSFFGAPDVFKLRMGSIERNQFAISRML